MSLVSGASFFFVCLKQGITLVNMALFTFFFLHSDSYLNIQYYSKSKEKMNQVAFFSHNKWGDVEMFQRDQRNLSDGGVQIDTQLIQYYWTLSKSYTD